MAAAGAGFDRDPCLPWSLPPSLSLHSPQDSATGDGEHECDANAFNNRHRAVRSPQQFAKLANQRKSISV
jgi:hypothetical protein